MDFQSYIALLDKEVKAYDPLLLVQSSLDSSGGPRRLSPKYFSSPSSRALPSGAFDPQFPQCPVAPRDPGAETGLPLTTPFGRAV